MKHQLHNRSTETPAERRGLVHESEFQDSFERVGRSFTVPAAGQMVLGSTTKIQIHSVMGKPATTVDAVTNDESVEAVGYQFSLGVTAGDGMDHGRSLKFWFHDGVLVGIELASSFKVDRTSLNVSKAMLVRPGMSRTEVEALLGQPAGQYRYPMAATRDGESIGYLSFDDKSSQASLLLELDAQRTVREVDLRVTK